MIQGIQSNTYTTTNSIVTDNIKKTSSTDVEQEITKSKISKTDTVEISVEGRLASEINVKPTDSVKVSAPPAGASPSTSTESTEIVEATTVLTTLTEAQLDNLVENGTITQAEKNSEMSRRESLESEKISKIEVEVEVDNDSKTKTNVNLLDGGE